MSLIRIVDKYLEEILCGLFLAVMASIVFLQVIMRYVFYSPLSWTDEVASYCMVWLVYIGAGMGVRKRAHIRVFNLIFLFGHKTSMALMIFCDLIWVCFNIFMVYQGILLVISFWEYSFISPALEVDQKWPYLIIPVGFSLMTLRIFQIYYQYIKLGIPLVTNSKEEVSLD